MNREALLELAERIEGNAWMMRRFLHDPDIGSVECAVEILGRIGIIEGKLAQLRKELAQPDESGRPDSNVTYILGDRPTPSPEAA